MSKFLPPSTGGNFEMAPSGNHISVCYRFIDLGTQDTTFKGTPKKTHLIILSWELPDEKMEDGRPFSISKRYTWSTNEKAILRKDLESWRGVQFTDADLVKFDIATILGKGCMLNVVHAPKGDKTYANVTSVTRLPKGMTAPAATNPLLFFDLDNFDQSQFDGLSQGLRDVIVKSPEYQIAVGLMSKPSTEPPPPGDESDYGLEEIPF